MVTESKLSPNLVWLFALLTLGVAIGATYLVPHVTHAITPKAMAGVYGVIFFGGAVAAMWFTSAGALRTVGAFAAGGAGLGLFYYVIIARAMRAAAEQMGASSHGADAFGSTTGLVFAALFGFAALAAGIGGAIFGSKLRRSATRLVSLAAGRR